MHEQVVLRQEAGEQHPVPVFVGKLLGELVDLLGVSLLVSPIPGLLATGAESGAKQFVGCREVIERLGDVDGPPLERGPCGRFRQVACLDDDVFELPAKVGRQRGHVKKLSVDQLSV